MTSRPGQSRIASPWTDEGDCRAILETLDRIGDKWTVMVVGALSPGPMRFTALQRSIDGVSHRMLTVTLRSLQRDGLVTRTAFATVPPTVEYALTDRGRTLIEPLTAIARWAVEHRQAVDLDRARWDDPANGPEGSTGRFGAVQQS